MIVSLLAVFGPRAFDAIAEAAGGAGPAVMGDVGGAVTVLVVF